MRVWGFGETIRSQGASYRDVRWERKNHQASFCTRFASWCADYLLGPITLVLINEHTTYNLSEKREKKIWHMFGGCKRASPQIWKHLPQTAGLGVVMETTLEQGYDTEIWFKSLLWNACVKNLPWGWPRQGGVLRGKAGTLCPREVGGGGASPTYWYVFIFHLLYAQYGVWHCRRLWGRGWQRRLALQWLCIDNFWCQQINSLRTYSELSTVLSDLPASPHLILITTLWMNWPFIDKICWALTLCYACCGPRI